MLSHFQDKWLPSSKTVLDSLRLPKLFETPRAPPEGGTASDAETAALAVNDELEQVELEEEMGFQERFESPEARPGDALAQLVAIVRVRQDHS